MRNKSERCLGKAFVSGMVAGLVGAWTMNQFWVVKAKLEPKKPSSNSDDDQQESREENNPTVTVAETISHALLGRGLAGSEKSKAGSIVHYTFGALTGAVYGVLAELSPATKAGFGTAYGAALWATADEAMVPALKLSPPPQQSPLSAHLGGLGAHLVYGVTTEGVRRFLRPGS